VLHKWRQRRVRHKSPVKMPRVAQELQLIAMEAVAIVGEQMDERDCGADADQDREVGSAIF
jgi:hypothetical protein